MLKDFLKRPEVLALVIASALSGLVAVAARSGVALPADETRVGLSLVWAWFVGTVLEGAFTPNYAGGLATLTGGKARVVYVGLVAIALDSILSVFGISIPAEAKAWIAQAFVGLIMVKGGLDAVKAAGILPAPS